MGSRVKVNQPKNTPITKGEKSELGEGPPTDNIGIHRGNPDSPGASFNTRGQPPELPLLLAAK